MNPGDSFNLVRNILNIRYIENEGVSFGMLKDHRWIFMSLSSVLLILMLGAILYMGRKKVRKKNFLLNISLALMFGGGVGNMIDRVLNESVIKEGAKVVVDFLEFDFVNFAVFNLADAFICAGAVLFCVCLFAGKYDLAIMPAPADIPDIPDTEEKNGAEEASES
jgi:signal peptidase II